MYWLFRLNVIVMVRYWQVWDLRLPPAMLVLGVQKRGPFVEGLYQSFRKFLAQAGAACIGLRAYHLFPSTVLLVCPSRIVVLWAW